jgi:hypothetical protein
MEENELKYADHCIELLLDAYPVGISLSMKFDGINEKEAKIVIANLKVDNLIERKGIRTKLTVDGYTKLKKFKSYSDYKKHQSALSKIDTEKENIDFELKKLQKESLEYQKTIREKDEEIKTLTKENLIIQTKLNKWGLFKIYWWISVTILAITVEIATDVLIKKSWVLPLLKQISRLIE